MAKLKFPDVDTLKDRVNEIKTFLPKKEEKPKEEKSKEDIPSGHVKCPSCNNVFDKKELGKLKICPKCARYFRLNSKERVRAIADTGSFNELFGTLSAKNPLNFPEYEDKIAKMQEKTGLKDAVITGTCTIGGQKAVLGVMDSGFMMASMGSVVGEKLTRAFEYATENKLPIVIFACSGGARMQEGIVSLMQMAKVSAAAAKHSEAGELYITVLTDPTTGGVTASFAMLGDIILSEPKALIGFAGRRVIEGTIKQKLPDEFQTAEFQLEHGFVDKIVAREQLPEALRDIIALHYGKAGVANESL